MLPRRKWDGKVRQNRVNKIFGEKNKALTRRLDESCESSGAEHNRARGFLVQHEEKTKTLDRLSRRKLLNGSKLQRKMQKGTQHRKSLTCNQ